MIEELSKEDVEYFDKGGEVELPSDTEPSDETPAAETPEPVTEPETPPEEKPADEAKEAAPEAEDATAKPEGEEDGAGDHLKTVPFGVFHGEKQEHKKTKVELEELRVRTARMEGRFNTLAELQRQEATRTEAKATESEAEPAPDYATDPAGFLKAQATAQAKELDDLKAGQARTDEVAQRQAAQDRVMSQYRVHAAEYAKEQPHFVAAYNHLVATETARLRSRGLADPAVINTQLRAAELALVADAYRRGQNPAEAVYNMAVASGFTEPSPEPDSVPTKTEEEVTAETKAANEAKLATVEAGQRAASPMATGGGVAPTKTPNLEAISKMSDAEFAKATEGDKWKDMFA